MINIDDLIDEIVGEGYEFWRHSARETLYDTITGLLAEDVPVDVIVFALRAVWAAAAAEYGD